MKLLHRLTIPAIAIIIIWCASNTHWGGYWWKSILIGDAQGYYSYLPAAFIYKDLNFGFYDSIGTKYFGVTKYDYRCGYNGNIINKYYCGTAIAMLPFFGVAHLITLASSEPPDGFSKYYLILSQTSCIVWLIIGLIYLKKLLQLYTEHSGLISLALIASVFGTNVFYYAISEPGVSHIFSFAFVTMFIFYAKRCIAHLRNRYIIYCFILFGMILLLRPVNGLILFAVPFLAENFNSLKQRVREILKRKFYFIFGMFLFLLIISIQSVIYKISAGKFWIDSYSVEHFTWSSPHAFDFLFSYKKGMFLYTPLLFISLCGFVKIWKENRYKFFSLLGFLALLIYIFSSWWMWFYGGSFGCRVMIEFYSFFAILFIDALQFFEKIILRKIFISFVFIMIIICQIQTYQYRYNHIHWSEMNKERYWKVFMRVDLLIRNENPNADLLTK